MACEQQFKWSSAARTDVGLVRSRNEDSFLDQPARGLWVVADGMGGHAYGDVASQMVVDALNTLAAPDSLEQFIARAGDQLRTVNQQLRLQAAARKVPVMGSTVVVLLACGRSCACLWAGDSRIYLVRNGRLHQLTRDHSQAEEMRARGPAQAGDPPAIYIPNMITRAVGAADTLDVDQSAIEVGDGDLFILCSDGLSNAVDEPDMLDALVAGDCAQAADRLIALALANGGRDNISVVVVRADDVDSDKTVINPAL